MPGLRREELAQLAGVSVDYYVRFEQGRADNASDAVIDAVARALRLDEVETAHLYRLVKAAGGAKPVQPRVQEVRPGLLRLLETMPEVPAFIVGRRTDILAWNSAAAALLTDFETLEPAERNKAWLVFANAEVRGRYVNWEAKARDIVAYLRVDQGRHPGDPSFAALVEDLSAHSDDFRRLWEEQEVRDKTHGSYHMRHPIAGEFTVAYESLRLPDDPDQTLITYTAEAGSPSEAALGLLAQPNSVVV